MTNDDDTVASSSSSTKSLCDHSTTDNIDQMEKLEIADTREVVTTTASSSMPDPDQNGSDPSQNNPSSSSSQQLPQPLLPMSDKEERKTKGRDSRDRKFVGRSMFQEGFEERRDLEQYFWTEKTINSILDALKFTFGPDASCCLCTPTLAHTWWVEGEAVNLLDIDTRFQYLPKFRYFDLRLPAESELPESEQANWRVIVFDPPFFYIPMTVLYEAVLHVCQRRIAHTKLLVGFLKREEKTLLEVFKEFNLKRTNFPLEYAHVKSNKWVNYAMYSNVDLPGIKRIHQK